MIKWSWSSGRCHDWDHQIFRVGRGFCRSSSLRQGHLEQVAQERVQVGLECLQRGRPHIPGQLFQCSAPLHGKKFILVLRWNFLWYSSWLAPCPVTGLHQNQPVLCCERTSSARLLCLRGKGVFLPPSLQMLSVLHPGWAMKLL